MKRLLVLFLILALPFGAFAKIKRSSTKRVVFPEKVEAPAFLDEQTMEKLVPLDLDPEKENDIALRIADRGFQMWFESPQIQSSIVGRSANTVQKKLKTDVVLKPEEPLGIEHKFTFQLMALQSMARLQYAGWLNAAFNYDAKASASILELSDKIFRTDLFVNLKRSSAENVSSVGFKWDW